MINLEQMELFGYQFKIWLSNLELLVYAKYSIRQFGKYFQLFTQNGKE